MRLLITRPIDQSRVTADKLRKLGHQILIEPLLTIFPVDTLPPDKTHNCIILTSSNAVPALNRIWPTKGREQVPVLVTGGSTRKAAISAGFLNTESVDGSATDIAKRVPDWVQKQKLLQSAQILYPCSTSRAVDIGGELATLEINCTSWPVYESIEAEALSAEVIQALREQSIDMTLLYSPRTAATFVRLLLQNEIRLESIATATLSPQITQALPAEMQPLSKIAPRPDEDCLFDFVLP